MSSFKLGNIQHNATTVATSGSTTTLLASSSEYQIFTGTQAQTVVLPDATTYALGLRFLVVNQSTSAIVVQDAGANLLSTVDAGSAVEFLCDSVATANGSWKVITFGSSRIPLTDSHILVGDASGVATDVAVSGDVTISNTGDVQIVAGAITNSDINANAAINASKIANGSVSNTEFQYLDGVTGPIQTQINNLQAGGAQINLPNTQILVGNSSNIATPVNVSGDVTITNTGNVQISAGVITNADINATAAIDATKIANGSVSNTEFQYLDGVNSQVDGINDARTLTNKTLTAPVLNNAIADVMIWDDQTSAPANPSAGLYKTYFKTDGKFYKLDSAGNESELSGTASTVTRKISQTAHGFTVGQLVRYNGTSYVLSQANSDANAEVYGMVSAIVDANTFVLASEGYITGLSGLAPASTYYLSTTVAGQMTTTIPTLDGQVSKPVFLSETATTGHVIQSRGIVIATGGSADVISWTTQPTPSTPASGFYKTYFKADGILYKLDSNGVETSIGVGGDSASVKVAQTAHGFSVGTVIYHNGTAFAAAQANTAASAEVIGIVSVITDANNFVYVSVGNITGLSGLNPGTAYYLSPTVAGGYTATEPSTAGQISKPVMIATSTTTAMVIQSRGFAISAPSPFDVVTWDDQASTPTTPTSGLYKTYFKTDGKFYKLDSTGTETEIGALSPAVVIPVTQTAHGFTVGQALYWNGTAYALANANSAVTSEVAGLVYSVTNANSFNLITEGAISGLSGLVSGSNYYLSPTTSGLLVTTEPTAVGQISKPVLVATSATTGLVKIDRGIEISTTDTLATAFTNLITLDTSFTSTKLTNATAEASVGDWLAYADAAGATPVDMTGGSPVVTIARSVTSPLDGIASFEMTIPSGATQQGQGVSLVVNIPPAFRRKRLVLTAPFSASGTIIDGDVVVAAYDITNSTLLSPFMTSRLVGASGKISALLDIPSNTTQIRIGFHVARSVNTAALTLKFDDILLTDKVDTLGMAGSDWIDAGPTVVTSTGTSPTKGPVTLDSVKYRRVGDSAEIEYQLTMTSAGSAGSGDYLYALPAGLSVDMTKLTFVDGPTGVYGRVVGNGWTTTSSEGREITVAVYDATRLSIGYANGSNTFIGASSNAGTFGSGPTFPLRQSFKVVVPIAGWSSNVTMGDSATFNVSAYLATGTRVTTTPSRLGEYRTLIKNSGAVTAADNAPTNAPSVANGMQIYAVNYGTGGTSGQPNRYEIFIGRNKSFKLQGYGAANRTSPMDMTFFGNGVDFWGVTQTYDANTGVLIIDATDMDSATTGRFVGRGTPTGGGARVNYSSGYFDIIVSENALSVGTDLNSNAVNLFASPWVDYPMVITATTTAPTKGATIVVDRAQWRRSGPDSIDIRYDYRHTAAGSNGSGNYLFSLPTGFTVDSTKIGVSAQKAFYVGSGKASNAANSVDGTTRDLGVYTYDANNLTLSSTTGTDITESVSATSYGFGGNPNLTITFQARVPVSQLANAYDQTLIKKDPVTQMSGLMISRVTTTPANIGEYRSYQQSSGGSAGTDAVPNTLPSATNGFALGSFATNAAGSGAYNISRYEIFIGKGNPTYSLKWYANAAKTGHLSVQDGKTFGVSNQQGVSKSYDPNTGVLIVDCINSYGGSTTAAYIGYTQGSGGTSTYATTGFFEVELYTNPLAAGLSASKDQIILNTGNGYGSTATAIRRYSVIQEQRGTAMTLQQSSVNGDSILINTPGVYTATMTDARTDNIAYVGISKNASAGERATSIAAVSTNSRLGLQLVSNTAGEFGTVTVTFLAEAGDVVYPHGNTGLNNTTSVARFSIVKHPDPLAFTTGAGNNLPPVKTYLTSGSGTYVTPAGATRLEIRMVGGGGGGGAGVSGSSGGNGGATTFGTSLLTAGGGIGGGPNAATSAAGGTGTINSPAVGLTIAGGSSQGAICANSSSQSAGGNGGNSAFGGGGGSSFASNGSAGATNSGAGGGGGGASTGNWSSAGGGAGAYIEATINSPNNTYAYSVGAGGTAGSGSFNGGAGGSGLIIVTAHFN